MNLKALFNKNFFKENLKKSRGMLAFFLGVVPLINLLVLVIGTKDQVVNFNEMSIITFLGLYFIPVIFGLSLFNFVFKRVATDFVMAKPISRKTMYWTNVLGGIGILFLFVLLNGLIFALFGLFFPNLIIPGAMILDYMIFWFISYVFMFVVTVMAITFSGNLIGSLVVGAIVICLVPFLDVTGIFFRNRNVDYYVNVKNANITNYVCRTQECLDNLSKENYRLNNFLEMTKRVYTTPGAVASASNSRTIFNILGLIKMAILSVIYSMVGYFSFRRRKMENNEVSFKSEFIHYLVKTITFLPVCLVSYEMMKLDFGVGLIVSLVGIFIYYIVYDLVTRKAIYRFKKSILVALFTFILLNGGYLAYDIYTNRKSVVIDEISMIKIADDVEIRDKEIIKMILRDAIVSNGYGEYVTLNRGHYGIYVNISGETQDILNEYYKKIVQDKVKNFNYQSIDYNSLGIKNTKKFKELVQKAMAKGYEEDTGFQVYDYRNHNYQVISVPYLKDEALSRYVLKELNKMMLKTLDKSANGMYVVDCSTEVKTSEELEEVNEIIRIHPEYLKKYLKDENTNIVDGDMCRLRVYNRYNYSAIIGDIDKFIKFMESL